MPFQPDQNDLLAINTIRTLALEYAPFPSPRLLSLPPASPGSSSLSEPREIS